jgi:hypothetical protein
MVRAPEKRRDVHRVGLIRYLTIRGEISDFVRLLSLLGVLPLELSVLIEDVDEFLAYL